MAFVHLLRAAALLHLAAAAATSGCGGHGCGHREALEQDGLDPILAEAEYETYMKKHGRTYEPSGKQYWLRRGLFEQRNAAVKTQNAKLGRLWQAVAGPFADFTEAERSSMRGYRSSQLAKSGGLDLPAAAAKERELLRPQAALPKEFDWLHLAMANKVPDQGQCGSCWAVTAKSVLDAHYEIYVGKKGPGRNFSAQQIVTCVPNPRVCGGTGGCGGATVELAFDWVVHNGCADESHVPYTAKDLTKDLAKCNESKILSMPGNQPGLLGASHGPAHDAQTAPAMGGTSFGMHGYHMLERNKEQPLLMALYQHGPVATSVAAGAWFEYGGGLFDGCDPSKEKDTIVDHAVTLFGFGEAAVEQDDGTPLMPIMFDKALHGNVPTPQAGNSNAKKYWLIRNSWGKEWGEEGFIRMVRLDADDQHCGQDSDNSQGTGCKGDTKTVEVCGMCGFLWDSVVPHFSPLAATPAGSLEQAIEMDPSGKLVRREAANHGK